MDPQIARLLKKVKSGKAVLFIGAGASCAAGAPLGNDLATQIHEEFLPETSPAGQDLIEVCSKVLDTPGVDRATLEEFIRSKLDRQPTAAHKALCRNRWQAIFTTNYDDLIETAYRTTPDRLQRCDAFFGREFARSQSDYVDVLRLFKLMGCVSGRDEHSQMALSRSDYNRKLRQRGPLFKLLYDFVKDGTIVYVGYSFKDNLARDIIDEVSEEVGADRLPWSWALLPEWDSAIEALLRQRKILPLKMSFEEFLGAVNAMPAVAPDEQTPAITLTIMGTPIDLTQQDVTMYDRQFFFLHDQVGLNALGTESEATAKRRFLEGGIDPWHGIRNGWALRRSSAPEFQSLIVDLLNSARDKEAPVVLLSGPAGSGKTTLVRLVAFDIYRSAGIPCIFLHINKGQLDFLVIDSFARQIVNSVRATASASKLVPILIVLEEAAEKLQDLRRLTQYLISRGIISVILAVTRENEWGIAQRDRPFKVNHTQMLPDKFQSGSDDAANLVRHFRNIQILISAEDDATWVQRIARDYDNSFQTALYYLAEPSRPPLGHAIRNEYDRMLPLAQMAYRYVSIFYQFGISIDLELLARSLNRSYEDFINSVYDPASLGVIIEDSEQRHIIRFRGRSRMVCERIIEHCYPNPAEWLGDLAIIVGSLMPQNVNEIDTIRRLLILKIGPRGAQPFADLKQIKVIFERALDAGMHDSATLHHFALLFLDLKDYNQAEVFLTEAIRVIEDDRELGHFKTESRQNLYNSMGMVIGRRGLRLQLDGKELDAVVHFDRAAQYFRSARVGNSPSAYPYYCESFINYSRARNCVGAAKLPFLAAALRNLDESDGNAPDEDKSSIVEMEAKILQYISTDLPNINELIESQAPEGDREYLSVRIKFRVDAGRSQMQGAYDSLRGALERTPNHVGCLRLAARLHILLFPENWAGWSELLHRWYRADDQPEQCGLLFDLGYSACELGKYTEAARYLEELDRISTGHPRRSGIIKRITDGRSDRRLSGIIRTINSPADGWIRSDALGHDVKFLPIRQKFTAARDQSVTFSLALNYRGILAVDLRPT